MPDNNALVAQAKKLFDALVVVRAQADALAKQLKAQVGAAVPTIDKIHAAADNALQGAAKWNKDIAEARKLQPLVDKIKEAAGPAKNLRDATGTAEKAAAALKGEADMALKIADKSGKEDAAIGARLKVVLDEAEKSLSRMQSYAGPGGDFVVEAKKALDQLLVGRNTPPVVRDIVRVVGEDLKSAGEDLTTAESVYKNMPPILKPALDAYIPEVRKKAQEGQALHTKLGGYITQARTKLGKDLATLKAVQDKLKTFK